MTFHITREREAETAFYLETVAQLSSSITVHFNPQSLYGIQKFMQILDRIKSNNCAQRLKLRPKFSTILITPCRPLLDLLQAFLAKRQFPLQELDLGGMECFTWQATEMLEAINCAETVQSLGLASVKSQPTYYLVKPVSTHSVARFANLWRLSVDYDYFSDEWLSLFENLSNLREIVIHLHGVEEESHPGTSDAAWAQLTTKNPSLRLHLVLVSCRQLS